MSNLTNLNLDVTQSPDGYANRALNVISGVAGLAVNTFTIAATTSLVYGTASTNQNQVTGNVILIDPGAAGRTVNLPPESTSAGVILIIVNKAAGAYTLTIKDSASSATILTLAQNKNGIVMCNGTTWYSILTA